MGVFDERECRVCGCTEEDCGQCVERTGRPCYWIEYDLCSACRDHRNQADHVASFAGRHLYELGAKLHREWDPWGRPGETLFGGSGESDGVGTETFPIVTHRRTLGEEIADVVKELINEKRRQACWQRLAPNFTTYTSTAAQPPTFTAEQLRENYRKSVMEIRRGQFESYGFQIKYDPAMPDNCFMLATKADFNAICWVNTESGKVCVIENALDFSKKAVGGSIDINKFLLCHNPDIFEKRWQALQVPPAP